MEESRDREAHRSLRSNLSLGVILMGLDHFKVFNATTLMAMLEVSLLRAVGELLRTGVRTEDIACRYGGEEFAIIWSETALEVIVQRAESLRQLIKNSIADHRGASGDSVTVSLGVAITPDHGKNGEDLSRSGGRGSLQCQGPPASPRCGCGARANCDPVDFPFYLSREAQVLKADEPAGSAVTA
jgi:diguanylate cyclase (GGDEF)-like protein